MEEFFIKRFIVVVISFIILIFLTVWQGDDDFEKGKLNFLFYHFTIRNHSRMFGNRNYWLNLEIPSVGFNDYIYDKNSSLNDSNVHFALLKDSDLTKNIYYFVGHSGYGNRSYFNSLHSLKKGDVVIVRFFEKSLYYIVYSLYLIEKDGYMLTDDEEDVLYLITCSLKEENKQLVIKAYLTN